MPKNRLKLNFELESAEDRTQFVTSYLDSIKFVPTETELETISNYILWGKNSKGKNAQQNKEIELKKWTSAPVESLEGLIETPGFQESSVRLLSDPPTRLSRTTFDRKAALENSPPYLQETLTDLWRQIDELELQLNYYELWVGKRKLPPRSQLENLFTEEERRAINEKALRLSQFKYLKLRHQLIELRTQQYIYQDSYKNPILPHFGSQVTTFNSENLFIGEDIMVYPAGLKTSSKLSQKLFPIDRMCAPQDFTPEDLTALSKLLWEKTSTFFLDFTNPTHILSLYRACADLEDARIIDPHNIYGTASYLLETLFYYEARANLTPLQKDLLTLKLTNTPNLEISKRLNSTYNKTYNENYISTIFHQKIIMQVAAAASLHREVLENIFYPENFKKCKDCGQVLLMNTSNFVRQKKSSDGFSPRCKQCEKIKRSKKKEVT